MSSLSKLLSVLDLFTAETSRVTAEHVMEKLSLSRTTAYRYLRTLSSSGLLARFSGFYVLGPRAIELDYLIRTADPLLGAAESVLLSASADNDCDLQLLALSGDHVIVTHHISSDSGVTVSYGRGKTTPLFLGAGARVIMATLPVAKQKALVARHQARGEKETGKSRAWSDYAKEFTEIRRQGYYISRGELDRDSVGVAAPIVHSSLDRPAAVVLVMRRQRFALADEARVIETVRETAKRIRRRLDIEAEPLTFRDAGAGSV